MAPDTGPLSFHIGSAYFTPIGFMDFTTVWRNHDGGSGIGTNFASIPFGFGFADQASELRFSVQNSRIGFRTDAMVNDAHVIGYMEADFLGFSPGNAAVSTNSNSLRSRLYWVDVRKGVWELLAGQTWSLMTPGRSGISPVPSDIFITQNVDVNYQAGLVWGRIPELRAVVHPTKELAIALALEMPEQYIGGSAGGGLITLPGPLAALAGTQLNNGNSTFTVPNLVPDLIAKVAWDPSKRFHVELGGVGRIFRIWNPTSETNFSATAGGGFLNLNVEVIDGLRLFANGFASAGGGRYIFGQAPDLILAPDGTISTVNSASTVDGIEFTHKGTILYGYYGAVSIDQTTAPSMMGMDCTSAATCVGYGFPGSGNGQNKSIEEFTLGFTHAFWKDPKYGALALMGQYSFLRRVPWETTNLPPDAHLHMVFFNLRYTLPGAPPKMGE